MNALSSKSPIQSIPRRIMVTVSSSTPVSTPIIFNAPAAASSNSTSTLVVGLVTSILIILFLIGALALYQCTKKKQRRSSSDMVFAAEVAPPRPVLSMDRILQKPTYFGF